MFTTSKSVVGSNKSSFQRQTCGADSATFCFVAVSGMELRDTYQNERKMVVLGSAAVDDCCYWEAPVTYHGCSRSNNCAAWYVHNVSLSCRHPMRSARHCSCFHEHATAGRRLTSHSSLHCSAYQSIIHGFRHCCRNCY